MALSFPRIMPDAGLGEQSFKLLRVDHISPRVDGRIGAMTVGWPLWTATWSFTGMDEAKSHEWEAWVDSLRGPQRLFYGADLRRALPQAYAESGLPAGFGGDAATWSVNSTRDVLTLTGLPAGFVLTPGDMIGFRWGANRRSLVRVMEPAVGSTVSVAVEPAVPTITSGAAVAYLKDATCLMRLTPETDLGAVGIDRILTGQVSAIQELLA